VPRAAQGTPPALHSASGDPAARWPCLTTPLPAPRYRTACARLQRLVAAKLLRVFYVLERVKIPGLEIFLAVILNFQLEIKIFSS